MGTTHCLAYSCSKAAIDEMTRSLAVEWARYAICVNAILPGHFETDMSAGILSDPKTSKRIFERMPIRRAGRPDELKPLAVYLASRSSDYVTGQTFCIDGGYSIALYY
jgi:2-deoxy-D-gluconate 3-dehydrogenase